MEVQKFRLGIYRDMGMKIVPRAESMWLDDSLGAEVVTLSASALVDWQEGLDDPVCLS